MDDIRSRMKKILSESLQGTDVKNIAQINPDQNLIEQVNIDSMQYIRIFAQIENEFGIELSSDAMRATTLNQFIAIIAEQLAGKGKPLAS